MDIQARLQQIDEKLQMLRDMEMPEAQEQNLDDWSSVELTYNSNAIEGNTLTLAETKLVIENGITIEGKPLKDHLEALNHYQAYEYVKVLLEKKEQGIDPEKHLTEKDIFEIHRIILTRIDDNYAGRYRDVPVRITGSNSILPNYMKVPELMKEFIEYLRVSTDHPVLLAADAHYKFESIHPFVDGNGRTGRLIMNFLLMQAGYPPAVIKVTDRRAYITSLERAQTGGSFDAYYEVIFSAIERSLNEYLSQGEEVLEPSNGNGTTTGELLKIGDLAKETGEPTPTIRYWTYEGLLDVKENSKGGYRLYDPSMIDRVKEIQRLKNSERLTLNEIKQRFIKEGTSQAI